MRGMTENRVYVCLLAGTSVPRGSISCSGLQVQKLMEAWHRHTDKKEDAEGFHFVLTGRDHCVLARSRKNRVHVVHAK